ncbi:MAG: hypothetical protein Q7U38_13540 [Methylobacter sp.]|nr:hypothetical protein [Methylobacter sp.]MDP2099513.1 hypothetical protein [Methylobacter sp.]MDP2428675.1 hypothetical protein [Methylobacter sp.]MDP3055150.1 hypothetical protein [Methylobacter sp.]MDP3364221.1 hypothetical protein [Methylobacter sp.]
MKLTPIRHNTGVGLIEVLVATVVVAVGLLAVGSLQGDLMGGSRSNKTRAEAQALANTKIEQLRDTIERTGTSGYQALASSTANESITGVTETFSRGWTITNQTNPERKQVSVTVCWSDGCGTTANPDNRVAAQSVIAFDGLGNASRAADGAGDGTSSTMGGPSTKAGSSDEITETIKLTTAGTPGSVITVDDKTYIVDDNPLKASRAYLCGDGSLGLAAFENGLYTRRVDHDGVSGNEAIEMYEKVVISEIEYCMPKVRFNGGVIIPIKGMVYSAATTGTGQNITWLDAKMFTFNATESGTYCVFNPAPGTRNAPYVCYIGGNCTGFAGTVSTDVTACPGSIAAAKVGPGGWRGKVGLLGVAGTSSDFKNVCFSEELTAPPVALDSARNYFTRRAGLNEGINKPYDCHNFLIINGKSTEKRIHDECKAQAANIAGLILASKEIKREISGANVFDPVVDTNSCEGATPTAYTITGTITGASAAPEPAVTIYDGILASPATCTSTLSTYSCTLSTIANSVTISGTYNSQPKSCSIPISPTQTSPQGCTLAFEPLPVYTITGRITAPTLAAANAVSVKAVDGANEIACATDSDTDYAANGYKTYTCMISTATTTAGIDLKATATATSRYSVTPTIHEIPTLSGTTSTIDGYAAGYNFVAAVVPVYTISGSIFLNGNNVDNITTVAVSVNINTGTCSISAPNGGWKKNTTGTYSCSVTGGVSNALATAISPTCSNTKSGNTNAFKKYTLSATGVTPTTGTGQLVIDLGTVNSNQTGLTITITESNETC